MRMLAQDKSFCRTLRVDETVCSVAPERLRIVKGAYRIRKRFTTAAKAFGASRSTCCDWRAPPLNGGAKAAAPRGSRSPTHPGKRWTHADALRAFAIRDEMRWRGKAWLRLERNARCPDKPLSATPQDASRVLVWRSGASSPAPSGAKRAPKPSARRKLRGRLRRAPARVRQVDCMILNIDGRGFKAFREV